MVQVRKGVFETNSSSTHSIVICDMSDFNKWKNGELLYNDYESDPQFITLEKYAEEFEKYKETYADEYEDCPEEDIKADFNSDTGYMSYDDFINNDYLETDVNFYTTKSGDEIAIACMYGRDG